MTGAVATNTGLRYLCSVRALGLDVGTKTIGVAVSDELRLAAHSVKTIARAGAPTDLDRIAELIDEYGVTDIVIGVPLDLSGRIGPRARRVLAFMEKVRQRFGDVQVHEWDERFSTAAVERLLIEADVSRARRKKVVDKQAAAFILQGWLDGARRGE